MTKIAPLDPITIAFAKQNCTGIQVHCLKCQQMTVIGFDRFQDDELVIDLPKRRRFRCTRCAKTWVETRPQYPYRGDKRDWIGLEKSNDSGQPDKAIRLITAKY